MKTDPVIERIRQIRKEISAKFSHNPKKLVQHYIDLQSKYKDRLISNNKPEKQKI